MNVPIIEIDNFVEEKSTPRSTRETCAHKLRPIGKVSVTRGAGE